MKYHLCAIYKLLKSIVIELREIFYFIKEDTKQVYLKYLEECKKGHKR